ncbi:MAG TPA: hypothetical protein VGR00_11465 [Thermoanaerobaculia bacterium]|nr:hypothetical protein [Thermoanaerobaculia bacterium]
MKFPSSIGRFVAGSVAALVFSTASAADQAASLESAERRARAAIREHQTEAGYWLTSYTDSPRFTRPTREMNTFLTSCLVDLLEPVAVEAELAPNLAKARRHLTAQIEPGGLVRYHGLPDAPTIGTLGVRITPDSDDTALVWRIAPGPPESLREALATLHRYRTDEGLYRTWLAPRERFEGIDPGRDPNPPDVGIQMHLLLFFQKADPQAARELHASLEKRVRDESLWVYYRMAPLIPILRRGELARAGFPLRLPAERIQAAAAGQEPWVRTCDLLARFLDRRRPKPSAAETVAALRSISGDDFALLRQSPPLLYHNDFSARVSRFYWSEDFGYALWLRLRFENEHRR